MADRRKKPAEPTTEEAEDDPKEVARGIAETIRLEGRRGWKFNEGRGVPAQRVTGLVECLDRRLITRGQMMAGERYSEAFDRAYEIGRYRCALAIGISEEDGGIDTILDAVHQLHRARSIAFDNDPLLVFAADHLCGRGGQLATLARASGVDDAKALACQVVQALEAFYHRGRAYGDTATPSLDGGNRKGSSRTRQSARTAGAVPVIHGGPPPARLEKTA